MVVPISRSARAPSTWWACPELRGHVFRDRLRRLEEPAPILTRSHGRELRMEDRQEARRDFELVTTLRREEAMEEQGSRC